jgi:2'-5' RNA ligase
VTEPATVAGHEFLRLFCALTLPDEVQEALGAWQRESLRSQARAVDRSNLHVTLAFLGRRPAGDVRPVAEALRAAARAVERPPVLTPVRYRETRSVAMVVLADEDGRATRLATDIHGRLEGLGLHRRESRPWLPHVTVLRFRSRPRLQPALPRIEPFSPSGAAVYHSLLRSSGAQYEVLEFVPLGG